MRRKTLRGCRAASSAKTSHPTVRAIPLFVNEDEDDTAVPKTSIESNHDLRDVREMGSKGNMDDGMDEGSNRSPHASLGHDYIRMDFLDRKICITCNEGGEVLVCDERGCPITLHAKCICGGPKFDDMGNFYCPYCWYKRAVAEIRELRKKALVAKKDLSNFLNKNVFAGDKLVQKEGEVKRKELKELPLVGNGSCLGHCNRQGNNNVHSQPLQTEGDQQKEMEREIASADQHGITVEREDHENALAANTGDFRHYREEKTPVQIELVHNSTDREKFNVHNISETHEARFVEGKEGMEPEDSRYNDENVIAEAKPLSAIHFGKYIYGHSLDIVLAKGMQRTAYPQRVASVRKSLSTKSNTEGKNACYENKELTTSKTLREPRESSMQGEETNLSSGKRKRLKWTAEEESMLKEGVSRFSMENHNIPWKKILEFGGDVFSNTRTPVDLKDKWKNITAKEGVLHEVDN